MFGLCCFVLGESGWAAHMGFPRQKCKFIPEFMVFYIWWRVSRAYSIQTRVESKSSKSVWLSFSKVDCLSDEPLLSSFSLESNNGINYMVWIEHVVVAAVVVVVAGVVVLFCLFWRKAFEEIIRERWRSGLGSRARRSATLRWPWRCRGLRVPRPWWSICLLERQSERRWL